jgi:L-ascorbate metabolism protein UlaG (beta-lactamase superfamily)
MKITYYGHSCFAAEINGKHLLFDPFVSGNPLAKAVDIKNIKADYIFVSHAHFDHIADAAAIAIQTGAVVLSNIEIYSWLGKQGVKNVQPLNPGGTYASDFGRVKCVNAILRIPMISDTRSNSYRTPFRCCRTDIGAKRRSG